MNLTSTRKPFILNLLIFVSLGLMIYLALGQVLVYCAQSQIKVNLSNEIKAIVIGHSHPECAIDPSFFPGLANFGKSGEALFYGCLKGRKILQEHPEIKTVFIELSANQLDAHMEKWVTDEEHFQRAMKSYFFLLPTSLKWTFWRSFPLQYSQSQLIAEKKMLNVCFMEEAKRNVVEMEWGGFVSHDKVVMDSLRFQKDSPTMPLHPYNPNLSAILDFIQYCSSHGVEPVLIRTPVHASELDIHESSFQDLVKKNFGHLKFMDFRRFPLQDSCFLDREHLNAEGARIFTLHFCKVWSEASTHRVMQ